MIELLQGCQALDGRRRQRRVGIGEKKRISPRAAAAHPAAQLMELSEAELVRPPDDDGVATGEIEATLDDVGCKQYVGFSCSEIDHCAVDIGRRHLAVYDDRCEFGCQIRDPRRHWRNILDPRTHHKALAPAAMLAP